MQRVTNESNSVTEELHNHVEGAGGKGAGLSWPFVVKTQVVF